MSGSFLEALGEESASSIILVVGRIQFLEVIGLKSLLSCWLLARDCSQQPKDTLGSLPSSHVHLKANNREPPSHESLSYF